MPSPLAARLMVLLAAVLWSAGSFMKVFSNETPLGLHDPEVKPVPIAFWRGLFAGLALVPLVRFRYVRVRPIMFGMVACFAVMSGLYLSALGLGPAANAILLQNSAPVWVYLIGVYLLKQKPDGRALRSALLALVGVGVIVLGNWPWQLAGDEQANQIVILGMGAGSGLMYAAVVLFLSQLRAHSPAFLMVLNLLGSAAVLGVYLVLTGGFVLPTPMQLAWLALFGVVQMAAPYWLFARGLRSISPQEAGIITLLEPVLNPVWAYLIAPDKEVPTWWTLAGGVVLLVALAWRYVPTRRQATAVLRGYLCQRTGSVGPWAVRVFPSTEATRVIRLPPPNRANSRSESAKSGLRRVPRPGRWTARMRSMRAAPAFP